MARGNSSYYEQTRHVELTFSNFRTLGFSNFSIAEKAYTRIDLFMHGLGKVDDQVKELTRLFAEARGIKLPDPGYDSIFYFYQDPVEKLKEALNKKYTMPPFYKGGMEGKALLTELVQPLLESEEFKAILKSDYYLYSDKEDTVGSYYYAALYKLAVLTNDEALIDETARIYDNNKKNRDCLILAAEMAVLSIFKTMAVDDKWFDSRIPAVKNILFNLAVHQAIGYGYYNSSILEKYSKSDFEFKPFAEINGPLIYRALNEDRSAALEYIQKEKPTLKKYRKQLIIAIKVALSVLYRLDDELEDLIGQMRKAFPKGSDVTGKYDVGCRVLETLMLIGLILKGTHEDKIFIKDEGKESYDRQCMPNGISVGSGPYGLLCVRALVQLALRDSSYARGSLRFCTSVHIAVCENFFDQMFFVGTNVCLDNSNEEELGYLKNIYSQLNDFSLFKNICARVIASHQFAEKDAQKKYPYDPGYLDLSGIVRDMPQWQKNIDNLTEIFAVKDKKEFEIPAARHDDRKIAWIVDRGLTVLYAKEQKVTSDGEIQAGKHVSLVKLVKETSSFDFLSDDDFKVVSALKSVDAEDIARRSDRYYRPPKMLTASSVPMEKMIEACIGLENLFIESEDPLSKTLSRGRIEKRPLKCSIEENGDNYDLKIDEGIVKSIKANITYDRLYLHEFLRLGEDNVIEWYHIGGPELRAYELIAKGFSFPKKEIGRILPLFNGSTPVLSVDHDFGSSSVQADDSLVIQMEQKDDFFTGFVGVKPFGTQKSPFYHIASGPADPIISMPESTLAARQDDSKVKDSENAGFSADSKRMVTIRCRRDFSKETAALNNLLTECPTLEDNYEDGFISLDSIESLLRFLEELEVSSVKHSLEWARGNSIKVSKTVDSGSVHIKIVKSKKAGEWFSVDGGISLDNDRYISIYTLIDSLRGSRFISLGNGEYVALTEKLRKKLASLKMMTSVDKNKDILINSLAAGALEKDLEDLEVEADPVWTASVERMKEAFASNPKVPAALQAQLRDYQIEGYEWMQRLAIWGVGACLADDMGLGKTVQTIAVLLNQARKGPCLVLAPTSVGGNWIGEIRKFAPSLNVHQFDTRKRDELVDSLGKNDVLIVGYGLLANVEKFLTSRSWSMIVFDEAQALKNFETKRAKVCKNIEADFRLALTGTPIENRIEDLWSLFTNINPGLLGSWTAFHERFKNVEPGSSDSKSLKRLVKPFLLRRLKSAVLDELPSRTTQNIIVEMNDKEKVFYDNLRRSLVNELETAPGANKKFLILAGLTKLRRACCHPQLADRDMEQLEDRSSKIDKFVELVKELSASGHRVLAFSQFTSFLSLVEKALIEEHIEFKHLDGSTPEAERAERIAQFQAGEGDVFLLSLKAGGTGINLTAADYVIHLDPWWNPAVEDQASDRAHRLGQKRPVTIYRLVSENSVEEKILNLHAEKRELAADFLDGTSSSVKHMTEADLMSLMES